MPLSLQFFAISSTTSLDVYLSYIVHSSSYLFPRSAPILSFLPLSLYVHSSRNPWIISPFLTGTSHRISYYWYFILILIYLGRFTSSCVLITPLIVSDTFPLGLASSRLIFPYLHWDLWSSFTPPQVLMMFTLTPRPSYCKQERFSWDLDFAFLDAPHSDAMESSCSSVLVDYWPSYWHFPPLWPPSSDDSSSHSSHSWQPDSTHSIPYDYTHHYTPPIPLLLSYFATIETPLPTYLVTNARETHFQMNFQKVQMNFWGCCVACPHEVGSYRLIALLASQVNLI